MRLACDVGGTFTDLVLEDEAGGLRLYKSPTTPADPLVGLLAAVDLAASDLKRTRRDLLAAIAAFVHGTTRAINAILTGSTAKTAFLTTEGHRDVLVIREGGRIEPFNFRVPYPERVNAEGQVLKPLDEAAVLAVVERLRALKVEAVGVCLLWSIVNSQHERR